MDKAKDFAGDLAELKASIDVTDVLTALKESRTASPAKASTAANLKTEAPARPQRPTTTKTVAELPRRASPKPLPTAAQSFINVTTKLTPETKAKLRQAALLQAAHGRDPATEYGIVNQAVEDWLKRHGYSRRCKGEEQAHGEPTADPTEASEEA